MPAVEAERLTKVYGGRVKALDNVSFSAAWGEVTCLLGRNGAGKTTFIKIASTILLPSSGTVTVAGYDVVKEPWKVKGVIGLVPQEGRPIDFPTPEELIFTYLMLRGVSISEAKARTREALEFMQLWDARNTPIYKLSGGMRQRVLVAMALSTDARVLFLDEPTLGLDPYSRRGVWSSLQKLRREGYALILTTHYMEEAEALGDRVVILNNGALVADGSVPELIGRIGATHRVDVEGGFSAEELSTYGRVYVFNGSYTVYTDARGSQDLVREAVKRGVRTRFSKVNLEDAFINLTGGTSADA